jgi:hypothetical protein
MVDAPEDKAAAVAIPLDLRVPPPHGVPLILQVSQLDGSSDPDKFFYDPFADIKSVNFAATWAFFIYHGHVVSYRDCPDAHAFQELYPLASIRYISPLPKCLIAKGHGLLVNQRNILCALTQAPPPVTPPRSILDQYVAAGFADPCSSLCSAWTMTASCSPSASAYSSGLIHSPLVSTQGGDTLSKVVPSI